MEGKGVWVLVIVLALVAVGAVGYIIYNGYQAGKLNEMTAVYQQGVLDGQQSALSVLYSQAGNCNQVPLTFNNQTITLIAAECLQAR